eukprot:1160115-Pelagomonas_calceolata.AAC.7
MGQRVAGQSRLALIKTRSAVPKKRSRLSCSITLLLLGSALSPGPPLCVHVRTFATIKIDQGS